MSIRSLLLILALAGCKHSDSQPTPPAAPPAVAPAAAPAPAPPPPVAAPAAPAEPEAPARPAFTAADYARLQKGEIVGWNPIGHQVAIFVDQVGEDPDVRTRSVQILRFDHPGGSKPFDMIMNASQNDVDEATALKGLDGFTPIAGQPLEKGAVTLPDGSQVRVAKGVITLTADGKTSSEDTGVPKDRFGPVFVVDGYPGVLVAHDSVGAIRFRDLTWVEKP